jgi:hypothetical protein
MLGRIALIILFLLLLALFLLFPLKEGSHSTPNPHRETPVPSRQIAFSASMDGSL